MIETTLMQLVKTARLEDAVASTSIENDMQMMVYPLEAGVLVALGFDADLAHRVTTATVLRRRASNMERYGAWLPSVFNDGSWYVVRRIMNADINDDVPVLPESELRAAEELLS